MKFRAFSYPVAATLLSGIVAVASAGIVSAEEAPTSANLMPNFKANGMEIHSITLYKELADGTPVIAMAFCGVGSTEGSFALSVDFGQGMIWKAPEMVNVRFDTYEKAHIMQVMREYLGFEGPAAKATITQLVASKGELTFSGPRDLSVSFSLDGAGEELAGLKKLCKI
ncbi:hypothetical protein ACRQ1B_25895 [Rhizobium panacihumi]|uniref:hypothetical protein n=1 Tax=Rhizobium panacihumi TaxID=2008450 RepID=UPI003D797FA8